MVLFLISNYGSYGHRPFTQKVITMPNISGLQKFPILSYNQTQKKKSDEFGKLSLIGCYFGVKVQGFQEMAHPFPFTLTYQKSFCEEY